MSWGDIVGSLLMFATWIVGLPLLALAVQP